MVHRTLTMRSAISLTDFGAAAGGPGSLQNIVNTIIDQRDTIRQRRVLIEGRVVELRNLQEGAGSLLVHFVAYTPDDQISIVPNAPDQQQADLELFDAPEDAEFLDGELMALVSENDVALCRSGLNENDFISFVELLGAQVGIEAVDCAFRLLKRADMDKIEMIRREGIHNVSMNALAHAASVENVERRSVRHRFVGAALDELKALAGVEEEIPEDAENLKVEVLFSFDKRNGTELDQRQLASLAEAVLNDREDEGFVIETLSGRKIRADEVVLSKPVRLPAFGKSVSHVDAWGALAEFWAELNATDYVQ